MFMAILPSGVVARKRFDTVATAFVEARRCQIDAVWSGSALVSRES